MCPDWGLNLQLRYVLGRGMNCNLWCPGHAPPHWATGQAGSFTLNSLKLERNQLSLNWRTNEQLRYIIQKIPTHVTRFALAKRSHSQKCSSTYVKFQNRQNELTTIDIRTAVVWGEWWLERSLRELPGVMEMFYCIFLIWMVIKWVYYIVVKIH